MRLRSVLLTGTSLIILAAISVSLAFHFERRLTKVHVLEFPLLLGGPEGDGPFQLLPKGTTLYYDQSYPEGFTRYRIYVNVDHFPLITRELSDPTSIDPLSAYAMDQGDLKRLLDRNPITREDLVSILKSNQLTKQEIRELLVEYSK